MVNIRSPYIIIFFAFIILCTNVEKAAGQISSISEIKGYELVWHDEFNKDTKPDTSSWSYEHGFVRNNELQWYQQENAVIENGYLIIKGKRERVRNTNYNSAGSNWRENRKFAEYTSASINTSKSRTFKYGIIEVRAKIDTAKGMWPAIWTLGTNDNRNWPANGEVDVMEFYLVDGEQTILANAAWAGEQNQDVWDDKKVSFKNFLKKDSQWPDKFHVWKMNWTKETIKLYLDGELLNEIDLDKTVNPDGFNSMHQPHYILLNLAIGSNGGDPSNTKFPKEYKIDYVRVYQKN